MDMIDRYAILCDRMIYMTVCETDPVNPVYGTLAKYKTIYCPSEFSRQILAKQFPNVSWKLLRHWAPAKPHAVPGPAAPYTFYTIGNALDPRKNIKGLIQAFQECNFGQAARLVIKATCIQPVDWKIPGVVVINGLMSDADLERIHGACHCYVNCSHSEGVGMGAVEAAMRSKPVIITDFGGLKEYVRTPWVVSCTRGPIGFNDFLFTSDLAWGHPSQEELVTHLKDCFEKRVDYWDHSHTRAIMDDLESTGLPPE
jgi:glycosyltransferase involved in cell wall biosynthesis